MTTTSIINDLIETLKDGQEGFRAAAEQVSSPDFKALFNEFSQQRAQFAVELQVLARDKGDSDPEESGSVAGTLHRGWIDLKAALTTRNEHAILAECERGEDSAVAAFREATVSPELTADVLAIVRRQAEAIRAAHNRIRDLRDSLAAK